MNHYKYLFFIFFVLASITTHAQDIKINYTKGNSILFFDLESKSKLSSSLGLSLHNKNYTFGLSYIHSDFSYEKRISSIEELALNYNNQIHTLNLSYDIGLGYIEKIKFDIGFNVSASNFEINSNLKNSQGLYYTNYSFEELTTLGYFSENNYESSLSDLNLDQLDDYPTYFFSFGPSLSCSYKIVDNFEISAKAVYRKNMTDLLDNINLDNTRNITANSQDDNQLDFFLGIKFNLSRNKTIDNDSLVNYIYSITEDDDTKELVVNEKNDLNSLETTEVISEESKENTNIISKKEYIFNLFEVDSNLIEESDGNTVNEENKNQPTTEVEEVEEVETEEEDIVEEIISFENNSLNTSTENSAESYYVIVGVFSEKSNLKTLAESLDIDSTNFFVENKLHYLYALSTIELSEARQLRDSLSVESWIYYAK